MTEGNALYSATPLRTNPADRFIPNEIFDYSSIELSDNDIYSQEYAIVSDAFQGQNPDPTQTKFRFLYEDLNSWIDIGSSYRIIVKIIGHMLNYQISFIQISLLIKLVIIWVYIKLVLVNRDWN